MSALLTSRPRAREDRRATGQEPLFGDAPTVEAPPVPAAAAAVVATPAPAPQPVAAPAGITLDAAVTTLWDRLSAGAQTACPVCEAPMEARHSAGAGVVGGRCRSCGSTLS
jgi:hypothetical protein